MIWRPNQGDDQPTNHRSATTTPVSWVNVDPDDVGSRILQQTKRSIARQETDKVQALT
jgi:hypothetical protein